MGKLKSRERAKGKGEGTKKKVVKIAKGEAGKSSASSRKEEGAKPFSRPQIFSRPKDLQMLFQAFREGEVGAQILRPRLQTESVEHGRGTGVLRNFSFRRFKDEPKAVLYINAPRSKAGGSFEPTDRLLNPGEQIRLTYSAPVEGSSGPVYFLAKGFFLRKSFLIPNDPMNDGKPWSGTREEAAAKFSKDLVINGDDVLELRIDTVNSFPGGPGRTDRMVLDRYLSESKLYIIPGGGGWNQKSTQGNFFDGVRDPLDKYIEREDLKVIDKVTIDEFMNTGQLSLLIEETLLKGVDHEVARPSVVKKPDDFLGEINAKLGFLLRFRMDSDIAESLARTFPKKAGKDDEVYLPLVLERTQAVRERYRVTFMVFPRDLIEERGKKSMERGLKFMPPYALHHGAENQNTFSKLLLLLNQRFREDEKPEDEKLKSEKLKASVDKRISEQRSKFVDEKLQAAFKDRVATKKRKDET